MGWEWWEFRGSFLLDEEGTVCYPTPNKEFILGGRSPPEEEPQDNFHEKADHWRGTTRLTPANGQPAWQHLCALGNQNSPEYCYNKTHSMAALTSILPNPRAKHSVASRRYYGPGIWGNCRRKSNCKSRSARRSMIVHPYLTTNKLPRADDKCPRNKGLNDFACPTYWLLNTIL